MEFSIWWTKKCFCVTLSVRVSILFVVIHESWLWVHDENLYKGHNNLIKLNVNISSIWLRFVFESRHMAMVGIHNHWGTFDFSIFKMKKSGCQFSLRIKSYSIYHILTCNDLEKDHAFATHKFQVLGWDILANKLKSWKIISYSLGTDKL